MPYFPLSAGSYEVNMAADTVAPTVIDNTPPDGAVDVSTTTAVTVSFSEPMDEGTIDTGTFELRDAASGLVPATITYNSGTNTATLTPTAPLDPEAAYTATVDGVADLAGNPLSGRLRLVVYHPGGAPCRWTGGRLRFRGGQRQYSDGYFRIR